MGSTQPGSVHGSRAHRDREFSTAASRTAAASVTGGSEPLSRDTWLWKPSSPPHPLPLRQAGSSVASRDGEGRAGKDSSPGGPHLGLTQPEAPLRKVLPHAAGHRVARGSGTAPRRAVGTRTVAQGSRAQRGGPERGFALERKTEVATGGRGARWPRWPSPGVSASGHFSAGREVPTISAGCVPSTGCRGCTVSCPPGGGAQGCLGQPGITVVTVVMRAVHNPTEA